MVSLKVVKTRAMQLFRKEEEDKSLERKGRGRKEESGRENAPGERVDDEESR